ncbi:MAG: heavy metal translocating P-type ATPase, partial [Verrucomicrobiota bacterium]
IDAPVVTRLAVEGVDCPDEAKLIQQALEPVSGVLKVDVNVLTGRVTIGHENDVEVATLISLIDKTGLKAAIFKQRGPGSSDDEGFSAQKKRILSVTISSIFCGIGLVLEWMKLAEDSVTIPIFVIAIISGGWFIYPKALASLRRLQADMNLLMTVAIIGAAFVGEWSESAVVVLLFSISELLESYSVSRARRAIQSLLDLSPKMALVQQDGDQFEEVPVENINTDAIIAIKSAARVPLDGEVVEGESYINQAPITGESMPVAKKTGDTVFAGTINGDGSLLVKVTKAYANTMLSRMIFLIEEAQAQKAPSQKFVDRFAKYYTPAVMAVALLVFVVPPLVTGAEWGLWFYRSLVLLVIACPCALVISTPVSIVSGLTMLARRGVLVKGGGSLESIAHLRALAMDKTGTITEGKPAVQEIIALNGSDETEILRIAAAIDTHSDHPIAKAIIDHAQQKNIDYPRSDNFKTMQGRGAQANIDGHLYFVGNHRYAHELGVCSDQIENILSGIEKQGLSVVVVGHQPHADCQGEVIGILSVGDKIRDNAAAAIKSIHQAGIRNIVMLSGDNQRTADAVAKQVGIDQARGDLLPEDKIDAIRELLKSDTYVGMIGDGVNDAPAMAIATVGISMGAAGTDAAIEASDITLMQDDLEKVAETIQLGRRTLGIIRFNIAFALGIKAVFLILAILGTASLWMAILADTGATLLVIVNALRLLRRAR